MTEQDDRPPPRLSDLTEWDWATATPPERRTQLNQLSHWIEWLAAQYPSVRDHLPRCWFMHPEAVHRLTAVFVAWIRTYAEPEEEQRALALVDWHHALDSQIARLGIVTKCVKSGKHQPSAGDDDVFRTDPMDLWMTSSEWVTRESSPPAPEYTMSEPDSTDEPAPATPLPPDMLTGDQARALLATGQARPLDPSEPIPSAIRYENAWWLGDGNTYLRGTEETTAKFDDLAARMRLADQAARASRSSGGRP